MRKLPIVAEIVENNGLVVLHDPISEKPLTIRAIHNIHHPDYVYAFLNGIKPLSDSQGWAWTEAIRDGVIAINAGQILGSTLALRHGIAANIAQGFHHACYSQGMGFCTFNGLALVAKEYTELRVGILDCDDHFGNGTSDFVDRLSNLFNYTIYGQSWGSENKVVHERKVHHCVGVRKGFDNYKQALEKGIKQLQKWKVNFVIYQAGMDAHIDDPYGTVGLTSEELRLRDRIVFQNLKALKLPVLFVLAGGYQEPIREKLAPLHVATFEEAVGVYNEKSET